MPIPPANQRRANGRPPGRKNAATIERERIQKEVEAKTFADLTEEQIQAITPRDMFRLAFISQEVIDGCAPIPASSSVCRLPVNPTLRSAIRAVAAPTREIAEVTGVPIGTVIHAMGVVLMALVGLGIRARLETRKLGLRHLIPITIGIVGAVGLLLAVLHGIEAAIWAAAYVWLGALDSPRDAILYSIDSMTTRGASGLTLERHWLTMGALEAADGMLLFGISTAYIFAVMQLYWPMLSELVMTRRHPR